MHKVPKHEEDEKEVHLCMRERGRGGRVCVDTNKKKTEQASQLAKV